MFQHLTKRGIVLLLTLAIVLLTVVMVIAQDDEATEEAEATQDSSEMVADEEMLAHGEYLAQIARCVACHTPRLDEFTVDEPEIEQRVTLSLRSAEALDIENNYLAGGREFNFGPAGIFITGNITSDEENGIGSWTDEELEVLLRLGVLPNGEVVGRLMPKYAPWSAYDLDSLIAYLRSLEANNNAPEESLVIRDLYEGDPIEALAELEIAENSSEDVVTYGEYLVTNVMRCTGCHTPRDPETGRSNSDLYLGGGQAYEGEWGIVYGSNISPDVTTGIGAWTDEQIGRVLREGVRISNRRLIFMPWQDYSAINDEDLSAAIAYLRSVDAVENEVSLPSINEEFEETVESQ